MEEVDASAIETEIVDFHETQMSSVFDENLDGKPSGKLCFIHTCKYQP